MIRTRIAQTTAVLALALGTVVLLPTAALATAPTVQATATQSLDTSAGTSPDNLTWG